MTDMSFATSATTAEAADHIFSAEHDGPSLAAADPLNPNNDRKNLLVSSLVPPLPPPPPEDHQDDRFSCNICFDSVTEPVVTQCGHLYCWPCLYRWLAPGMTTQERASLGAYANRSTRNHLVRPDESRRCCPVCKANCSVPTVVPIYVRSCHTATTPTPAVRATKERHDCRKATAPVQEQVRRNSAASAEERQPQESPPPTLIHNNNASGDDHSHDMGLDIDGDDEDENNSDFRANLVHRITTQNSYENNDGVPRTIDVTTINSDDNNNNNDINHSASPESPTTIGLRRRRGGGSESRDELSIVPTRPTPSRARDRTATETTNHSNNNNSTGVRPSSPQRNSSLATQLSGGASLSYGLILAMHQTLLLATSSDHNNNNTHNNNNNNSATNATASNNNNNPHNDSSGAPASASSSEEPIPSLHYPSRNNNLHRRDSYSGGDDLDLDDDRTSTVFLSRLLLGLSFFVLICFLSF